MELALITLLFVGLIILGIPIAFSIGIASLVGIGTMTGAPTTMIPMKMFYGLNSYVLLAVPLFVLTANIMNSGQISHRLINFSIALVGRKPGGLGHANVLVSMLFAGVSGSSTADTAGVGKILIPNMINKGYSREMSVGVTAASSTIGGIIPPSITMVIYGGLTNTSVGQLFIGGMVPGILIGLGMMFVISIIAKRDNLPMMEKISRAEFIALSKDAIPAMITPLIIIGGIVFGVFTPTEAAAFSAVYAYFVSAYYYKSISLKDLPKIFTETLKLSCLSLFALAAASALGEFLGYYQINAMVSNFFSGIGNNEYLFLFIIVAFFLFIGTFMDAIPAMVLFVPVIYPVALTLGVDPVQLGIVVIITLSIGLITPPYGLCLLIASAIGELSIDKSFKAVMPYISVIILVLVAVIFMPFILLI
ncbi:MAG: TRAP transporter large permease [Gammaproteobacteria bacterium]|jgi:C4-dicarboxylate transporter, DctM subunit|uniref:TRAP transporter large permease protein n=1 Tax=Marinomonas polaris DSM 16579 TaxID=1122206 RepID=A0A1M5GU49_9GAMM|nr:MULTISPECIES: TRAP transporter large permease [Marinomonas]MBU1467608.1 TRAP transporter large permease [Gammaproteobacteria bacterium]MBU2024838.1 TRAP transporter large permease [Gammaproteobacteria bacterium]MBU2238815.1 TRAP transporter large permease [Gammaproteobacteria bacterium]MBU2321096.1 TRAP transporter large permease [Gammaproteobacteria bacterium]MBU2413385.1 TRAP transporter large permease [Gammaproteobacteria bacterium]|tara:strand:+ start:7050 stop:8309 length:1260 start_codon:yes stop_codon:yes gene_type:complete